MQRVLAATNTLEHTRITFPATEVDNDQYINVVETPEDIFFRAGVENLKDVRTPLT